MKEKDRSGKSRKGKIGKRRVKTGKCVGRKEMRREMTVGWEHISRKRYEMKGKGVGMESEERRRDSEGERKGKKGSVKGKRRRMKG